LNLLFSKLGQHNLSFHLVETLAFIASFLILDHIFQVFVSEYAVTGQDAGKGSLYAALAEANFLIGIEKNR
jgi:alpha-N-arabinofuranosidase